MAWTDNLRPASFRGTAFKVDAHDTQGGRRTIKHEFPLRDKPYVEDMGRRAKEFSIDAYVVGDDYMRQRDALMRACDEAGSADLVHPYLGTLKVVCTGWTLRESKSEGRMARFSLSFVESGEAEFPSDSADPLAQANFAADGAKLSSIDDFARRFSIDGLSDFAVNDAEALLTDAAGAISSIARGITSMGSGQVGFLSTVSAFVGSLSSLMRSPSQLASNFFGLVEGVSSLFDSPRSSLRGLSTLRGFGSNVTPFAVTTSTRQRQQDNRTAIIGLVRQAAVIEASRIAPSATYETADDAQNVRDAITTDLDTIMEEPSTPDPVFTSLQQVRTAVVRGVPPEAEALPNLVTLTPAATIPSLVLAYDTYEDASRGDEIVTRNNIRYPGFVPGAEPLRVLSDA
ncbi:DNA circularization protein [Bordetella phage PY223]